jgi:MFS family permease
MILSIVQCHHWLVLLLVAASRYLVMADLTIADLIGVDLQRTFEATPAELLLARNAMPISLTMAIPIAVLMANRIGLGLSVQLSMACLAGGLLLAANAGNITIFAIGRVLQGFATAVVSSQTFALIQVYLPHAWLNRGVALIAAIGAIGLATGPLLASLATAAGQWRSVFVVLAAAVLLLLLLACVLLKRPLEPVERPPQSGLGLVAGSCFCAALALALTRWPMGNILDTDWMKNLELLAVVLLGSGLLLRWRRSQGSWRQPMFQLAFVVRLLLFGVVAAPNFFVVLFLRTELGWSVEHAALLCVAYSAALLLGIPLSIRLSKRLSLNHLIRIGFFLMTLSFLGWVMALAQGSAFAMAVSNSLLGFAMGIQIPAVTAAGMRAAPPGYAVSASAWLILADSLGPMLGLACQGGLLVAIDPLLERERFIVGLQGVYLSSTVVLVMAAIICGHWPKSVVTKAISP